ncbi:unnamed protein product [Sphagnum balticum]
MILSLKRMSFIMILQIVGVAEEVGQNLPTLPPVDLQSHRGLTPSFSGNKLGKDGKEYAFEHSLRVAGNVEEILDQTMEQYHKGWLLGVLHDNKEQNPVLFA